MAPALLAGEQFADVGGDERRFLAGEDVTETLPKYRISRDRKAILDANGPDIDAQKKKRFRFNPANLGSQLHYKNRWRSWWRVAAGPRPTARSCTYW